jgi:hypothetical protein
MVSTWEILDLMYAIYGQPTPAAMELILATICGQYSAPDAPKVLFHHIKNCTKIASMGNNPYTDCQSINNAIRLLPTTGLYQWPFGEWCQELLFCYSGLVWMRIMFE